MKNEEVKKMTKAEAAEKLEQIKLELMKLNSQVSTGTTLKNPEQIRTLRRTIAQLLTHKKIEQNKKNIKTKNE
jgi:large subunit ribosomal protein L29